METHLLGHRCPRNFWRNGDFVRHAKRLLRIKKAGRCAARPQNRGEHYDLWHLGHRSCFSIPRPHGRCRQAAQTGAKRPIRKAFATVRKSKFWVAALAGATVSAITLSACNVETKAPSKDIAVASGVVAGVPVDLRRL